MSPKPERLHGPVSQPPAPPQLLGLPESLLPTLVVFPRSPAGEQEDSMDRKETCLRVVVRVRPLTCQELRRGDQRVVHCLGDNTIYVNAAGQEAAFRASAAFDAGTSQEGLFEGSGMKRLIELAANGQLQLSASTRLRAQAPSSTHSPGTTRSTLLTPARAHSRAPLPLRVISAPPCAQLSDHSAGLHSLAPPRGGALHPPRKGAGAQRLFAPSPRFSCTAFAFGQTGSGKTYSLMGPLAQSEGQPVTPYLMGLMQRAFVCLLEQTQCYRPGLVLSASYVEIHNEQPFLLTHVLLAFWAPFPPAPAPLLCPGERPAEPRATQAPARAMEQNQGLLHREPADRGVWEPGGHHGPAAGRHPTAAERCARAEWALEPQPRPADHPHPPQGSKPRPQLLPARRALLRGPGRQREGEGHRLSWGALSGGQQHQPQSPGSGALHLSAGGPQTEAKSHPVQGQQAHPAAGGVPGRIWDHAHGCLHLPLLALPPGDTAHAALCKQGQEGHHQACGTQELPECQGENCAPGQRGALRRAPGSARRSLSGLLQDFVLENEQLRHLEPPLAFSSWGHDRRSPEATPGSCTIQAPTCPRPVPGAAQCGHTPAPVHTCRCPCCCAVRPAHATPCRRSQLLRELPPWEVLAAESSSRFQGVGQGSAWEDPAPLWPQQHPVAPWLLRGKRGLRQRKSSTVLCLLLGDTRQQGPEPPPGLEGQVAPSAPPLPGQPDSSAGRQGQVSCESSWGELMALGPTCHEEVDALDGLAPGAPWQPVKVHVQGVGLILQPVPDGVSCRPPAPVPLAVSAGFPPSSPAASPRGDVDPAGHGSIQVAWHPPPVSADVPWSTGPTWQNSTGILSKLSTSFLQCGTQN
ncbi:kinesin-like protein KIF12 isoform X4 [Lepidochelys kempii]|uniref:kinesin-like protein KIF12 isoform X4 n=1 Tax=Lepidochelys kempii TaxID=8472 RepID=UPI003C6EADC6